MIGRNNSPDPAEESRKNQDHSQGVSTALTEAGTDDTEYIRELTDTELDPDTLDMLHNLLSKDLVLGNLDEAEVKELRWIARIIKMEVEAEHPHHDSMWQGRFRQVASGKEGQNLTSLSGPQKTEILQLIQGVIARATRSRDGWQQEEINKSYAVSERREAGDDEGGFL